MNNIHKTEPVTLTIKPYVKEDGSLSISVPPSVGQLFDINEGDTIEISLKKITVYEDGD